MGKYKSIQYYEKKIRKLNNKIKVMEWFGLSDAMVLLERIVTLEQKIRELKKNGK